MSSESEKWKVNSLSLCERFTISTMANDGTSPAGEQSLVHRTRDVPRLEAYLAEAQKLSHTGSFGWKPANRELVFSEETYRIYEFNSAEKVTLEKLIEQVHPDDRALVLEEAARTSSSQAAIDFTHRLLLAGGRVKYLHVLATPLQNAGEEIEFVGAVVDITQAKQSEERFERSEKELRTFIEAMPASVGTNLPDGSLEFISQDWLDYSGLSRDQWREWGWATTIHPEDVDRVMRNWRAALNAGAPAEYELRCRRADGIYQWFLYRGVPLRNDEGNISKWHWTLTNINSLKDTESTLRTKEHQLLSIIETIPSMFWSTGPTGEITHLNQKVLDYCGVTQEGYDERGWLGFLHPDDRERSARIFSRAIETGEAYDITYRVQRADGEYRWQHTKAEPLRDPHGNIIQWYGLSVDIDEGKRAEEAVRKREHELRGIIETIPSLLWSTSPMGEVTHISQRVLEYTGLSFEDFLNVGWKRIIHPDDFEDTAKAFVHAIQTGESYCATHRLRRSDGEYRWYYASGEPLRDSDGNIIQWYGLSIDIDERKRAEDHLRDTRIKLAKASRLATVAELAASIAHELNQPLMSILANAQAAKKWLNAVPSNVIEAAPSIERIIRDARAADEAMQHIRALFKQESFDKTDVNIPEILREVVRVVQEDPKKRHVPIRYDFEEPLPVVHVDRIQMQQVFINLIVNAIEALEGLKAAPLIILRATTDSNRVFVQVIDNGPGFDDPDRIFDAFMTTKERGMGVGLAVSRTIVEAHGGRLWAEGNSIGGACFSVELPVLHATLSTA